MSSVIFKSLPFSKIFFILSDAQCVTNLYLIGILRKTAFCFARYITGQSMAILANSVYR